MFYRTHSLTLALLIAAFLSPLLAPRTPAQEPVVDTMSPIYVTTRVFQLSAQRGKYKVPSDEVFRVSSASHNDEAKWMESLKKTYPTLTPALLITNLGRVYRTSKAYGIKLGKMGDFTIELMLNGAQSVGDGVTPGTTLVAEVNQIVGEGRAAKPMTFAIQPIEVESGKTYFFAVKGMKLSSDQYIGFFRKNAPAQRFAENEIMLVFAFSIELNAANLHPRFLTERDSIALQNDAPKKVQPIMPTELLQSGLTGKVQVRVEINANGKVTSAITNHSTFPEMNEAVIAAARQWEFAPTLFAENKKPVSGLLTFDFPEQAAAPAKQQSSK